MNFQDLKKVETDYSIIASEFLGRKDGRLFYDPLPDPNELWQPYPGLRPEKAEVISQFLYKRHPNMIKSVYQRLSSAEYEKKEYITEARDTLIPPLERVLKNRRNAKFDIKILYSHENNEKKFNLGAINTFEYSTSKNQLDQARVDLTIARFDYLYKLKIVDFYEGKPIKLEY